MSGFDRMGFVDLASYEDDTTEMEQADAIFAMPRPRYFDAATKSGALEGLEEIQDGSVELTSMKQLARYRAWIGAKSLHIS